MCRTISRCQLILIALACLSLAGTLQSQPRPTFTTRDSAGIRIAVNGGANDSAIVLRESLRIGEVAGDSVYQFHRLGQMIADRQGTMFVVNGASQSIRVFGPDGKFVRQFGRRGQGPGEFSTIDRLWFVGDTLVVTDRGAVRATLFRKDGTVITTYDLKLGDNGRAELLAKTSSGWVASVRPRSREFSLAVFSLMRDTTEMREFDPATKRIGALLRKHAGNRRIAQAEVYPAGPLFEPKTLIAYGTGGSQYVSVDGQYSIDVFAPSGRLERRVIREIPPRPISQRTIQEMRETMQPGRGQSPLRPGTELGDAFERAAKYPLAPAFQQIGAILVAPDGSLLIQRIDLMDPYRLERMSGFGGSDRGVAAASAEASRWERIDASGRYAGAVRMPMKAAPRYFDGRNIFAVVEDDLGVQFVARFTLPGG